MMASIPLRVVAVLGVGALMLTGCAVATNDNGAEAKAEVFVAALLAAGLDPEPDIKTVASVFGDDGGDVCRTAQSSNPASLWSWGNTRLTAMPAEQVDALVEFDRLVVRTYCPGAEATFDELLTRLHYGKS